MRKLSLAQLDEITPDTMAFRALVRSTLRECAAVRGIPWKKIAAFVRRHDVNINPLNAKGNQKTAAKVYSLSALYYYYTYENPLDADDEKRHNEAAEAVFHALWKQTAFAEYQARANGSETGPSTDSDKVFTLHPVEQDTSSTISSHDDGEKVGDVGPARIPNRWKLRRIGGEETRFRGFFTFSLQSGQESLENNPVGLLLEIFGRPIPSDSGYSIGMSRVEFRINVTDENLCLVNFPARMMSKSCRHDGLNVRLRGIGIERFWDIESESKVLDRSYAVTDDIVVSLLPSLIPFEFTAEMYSFLFNGYLVRDNGQQLPSTVKGRFIKRLLQKEKLPEARELGRMVLSFQRYAIDRGMYAKDGSNVL